MSEPQSPYAYFDTRVIVRLLVGALTVLRLAMLSFALLSRNIRCLSLVRPRPLAAVGQEMQLSLTQNSLSIACCGTYILAKRVSNTRFSVHLSEMLQVLATAWSAIKVKLGADQLRAFWELKLFSTSQLRDLQHKLFGLKWNQR